MTDGFNVPVDCQFADAHCWHERRCVRRHTKLEATYEERCCQCGAVRLSLLRVPQGSAHGPFQ